MLFRSGEVTSAAAPPDAAPRTLARNRLGVMAVLAFIMASVAPLTVAAGVIPTAYAATGLTGIPAAFIVVAIILGVFSTGYVAMARHITNSGRVLRLHLPRPRPGRRGVLLARRAAVL